MRNIVLLTLGLLAVAKPAASEPSGWAALAREDLIGIHSLMAANHPGPVDLENPAYRRRLDTGLDQALARTVSVHSYADYLRALRFYTTSFRDGHVAVSQGFQPRSSRWPGFTVEDGGDGKVRVRSSREGGPPAGASLTACDGQNIETLMRDRVEPYYWNADLPHERLRQAGQLFIGLPGDEVDALRRCSFHTLNGGTVEIDLAWEVIDSTRLREMFAPRASQPALRRVGEVWFIDLPTFNYQTEAQVVQINGLVDELTRRAPEIADSVLVFDVRGNGGGNSLWANRVVAAVWGADWGNRVRASFDNTVDYRASPENLAALDFNIARDERNGLTDAANVRRGIRDRMAEAIARGEPMVRIENRPRPVDPTLPESPFRGQAFLLTDAGCASACLDFADLVRRLPGTRQIGGPTSADAVYIDNTLGSLPSGLVSLSYSLKVYRNRVRTNNQWYEPDVTWPKHGMTETEIAEWAAALARQPRAAP